MPTPKPAPKPAPADAPVDPAEIKNLLLLWFVIATPVGTDVPKTRYVDTLIGNTQAAKDARAALAGKLNVDVGIVSNFLSAATAYNWTNFHKAFHTLVQNALPEGGYIGDECPFLVAPIQQLLPAGAPYIPMTHKKTITPAQLKAAVKKKAAKKAAKKASAKKASAKKSAAKKTK